MGSYIIEDIIQLTGDTKSRAFWEKAVRLLGENIVAEEFGEMKCQMHNKNIREPQKYLTTLLKARLKTHEAEKTKQPPPAIPEKLKTYFEDNQIALFTNLAPLPNGGEEVKKGMEVPYSKSDVVQAKFRTADGEVTVIPMIRGRAKPKGEELGIPTVEHGRILAALENIWAQQGCPYHTYSDSNAVVCFCLVSIRELARLLGRTSFGGRDLVQLTNKVWNLKNMAYYLDMASVGFKNAINRGFSLLHSVELAEGMKHGQMETILKVEFSTQLSSQLLSRRAVTRPKQLAHIQSELGFLIRLYLEPILFSLDGYVYSKTLGDLIKDLALPAAPWHKYKSQRRRMFLKALKSMQNQKTTDGRGIVLNIEEGLTDYLLTARLEPIALPAQAI